MAGVNAGGCPYGVTGPCYGRCGRFTDGNGDGLCDFGGTVSSSAASSSSSSQDSSTTQSSSTDSSVSSSDDAASNSAGTDSVNASGADNNTTAPIDSDSGLNASLNDGSNFHILPMTLILFGAYFFTYALFKKGVLKPKQHKKLWNLLVTFGYLGTGITGVILTLLINMGIKTVYTAGINYWHAELALIMVIGTIIHFHIYRKPIKKMFKALFGFKSSDRENSNKKDKNALKARGLSK